MKALTIQQPWASAIVAGIKRVENRSWPTFYTGPLVIHSGKTSWPMYEISRETIWGPLLPLHPLEKLPYGALIGIVDVVDCQEYSGALAGDPFASGPWCWILRNPRRFVKPVLCRGYQGLWNVDSALLDACKPEVGA